MASRNLTYPGASPNQHSSTPDDEPPPPPDAPPPLATPWLQDNTANALYRSPDASPASSIGSVNTYASTLPSQEDLNQDEQTLYEIPPEPLESYADILPATSKDFSQVFPSTRRLHIRHDDSTADGNMNLRIDTTVCPSSGRPREMQLFHLRLHDLRSRDFSFRRYSRDSNREVCHSCRRPRLPPQERKPSLQKSLNQAFNFLRSGSTHRSQPSISNLSRHDSGYDSMGEELPGSRPTSPGPSSAAQQQLDDAISLEFSNYAQCTLRRRGPTKKHYDFEYWGNAYSWHRSIHKEGDAQYASFRLLRRRGNETVAHIVPLPMSAGEARAETEKGGWIPPCALWISDQATIDGAADVCDAVVATGLVALADDSIRRRFHSTTQRHLVVPLPKLASGEANPDYVDAHRLVDETFHVAQQPVRRWTRH